MTFRRFVLAVSLFAIPATALAQDASSPRTVDVGVAISTLGVEIEAATKVTDRSDVRVVFNVFGYSTDFDQDRYSYNASLKMRSVEAYYDWFPFGGRFHLSPGVMIYNGNQANLNIKAPTDFRSFQIGDATYFSDPTSDPVAATGQVAFRKASFAARFGWKSIIPRNRHWSVPLELGGVFPASPKATLNFSGSACVILTTVVCKSLATDPTIQADVLAEQNKINKNLESALRIHPVLSIGVGYSF